MITRAAKRACLERELKFRRRVYPRQISAGKMSQAFADEQIATLAAILDDYPPEESVQASMFGETPK